MLYIPLEPRCDIYNVQERWSHVYIWATLTKLFAVIGFEQFTKQKLADCWNVAHTGRSRASCRYWRCAGITLPAVVYTNNTLMVHLGWWMAFDNARNCVKMVWFWTRFWRLHSNFDDVLLVGQNNNAFHFYRVLSKRSTIFVNIKGSSLINWYGNPSILLKNLLIGLLS